MSFRGLLQKTALTFQTIKGCMGCGFNKIDSNGQMLYGFFYDLPGAGL